MDETGFLDLASDLSTGMRQADWRSAISRAYYAAFHKARQIMRQGGFTVPRGEQVHAYLWMRLNNSKHTDVITAGVKLNLLRKARNRGDYDFDVSIDQAEGFDAVGIATDITQLLHHLANEPAVLARVIDAIKIYESDVLREVTWRP